MVSYFKKYSWTNTTLDMFLKQIQSTEYDIVSIANSWLVTKGINKIKVEFEVGKSGKISEISVVQTKMPTSNALKEFYTDFYILYEENGEYCIQYYYITDCRRVRSYSNIFNSN